MASDKNQLTLRVGDDGIDWVNKTMGILDAPQSVVVRALFAVGTQHPQEVLAKVKELMAKPSEGLGALPEVQR